MVKYGKDQKEKKEKEDQRKDQNAQNVVLKFNFHIGVGDVMGIMVDIMEDHMVDSEDMEDSVVMEAGDGDGDSVPGVDIDIDMVDIGAIKMDAKEKINAEVNVKKNAKNAVMLAKEAVMKKVEMLL